VAAITGLHRKEIRLLTRDGDDEPLSVKLPPATRVMNGWDTDPTYKNKNGRPRSLRIDGEASFKTLVETYAGDVTHVALLRELERLKWVKRGASGKVEMHRSATDSRKRAEAVEYFAARIADYATALASPDGSFDSGAYAGHRESAPTDRRIGAALTRTFSRRAEEFLNSFDRWVLRSSKQTAGSRSASKYGIGVYLVERKVSDGVRALPKKGAQRLSSRAKRA
jgi:hypothetical protein